MPTTVKETTLYSVDELAGLLSVTATTIRTYLKDGRLKGQKVMGRWFIKDENVIEFFKKVV